MATMQNSAPEMAEEQAEAVTANKAEGKKKSLQREILEWVAVFVIAVTVTLVVRTLVFEPVRVEGESMIHTLYNDEHMIVTKYQYLFNDPERFDIVICRFPGRGNTNFVKRVVGVPGDTIAIRDETLFVNGEPIDGCSNNSCNPQVEKTEMARQPVRTLVFSVQGQNYLRP